MYKIFCEVISSPIIIIQMIIYANNLRDSNEVFFKTHLQKSSKIIKVLSIIICFISY